MKVFESHSGHRVFRVNHPEAVRALLKAGYTLDSPELAPFIEEEDLDLTFDNMHSRPVVGAYRHHIEDEDGNVEDIGNKWRVFLVTFHITWKGDQPFLTPITVLAFSEQEARDKAEKWAMETSEPHRTTDLISIVEQTEYEGTLIL